MHPFGFNYDQSNLFTLTSTNHKPPSINFSKTVMMMMVVVVMVVGQGLIEPEPT